MTDFATLNGGRLIKARVTIPYYGLWAADVVLASSDTLATSVTLTIGNLSMVGAVVRMASFAGTRSARIVGGAGGWRTTLPSKQYVSSNAIRLSQVLGDAAAEAGERLNLPIDATIGTMYVREQAPAQRVLRQLAGPVWYVDLAGVTQVQDRPAASVRSSFTVIGWSGALGRFTVATEDYASWLPGASFSSPTVSTPQTVSLVTHTLDNDGTARMEVLAA